MRNFCKSLGALALFAATATASGAATLYDSGITSADVNILSISDVSAPSESRVAQQATFATDVAINGAAWTGAYAPPSLGAPASDAFTLNIFADVANAPGAALISSTAMSVNRTDSATVASNLPVFEYESTFSALSLGAGTYWFTVTNDMTGIPQNWFWSGSFGGPGDGFIEFQSGLNADFDLTLSGNEVMTPVPLPASLPMLAGALLLLGVWRRRA